MPSSSYLCKREIRKFIETNFPLDSKILDVGSGKGTYAHLLSNYKNIDAVEAYEPYIIGYELKHSYKRVFLGDCTKMKFEKYDLVILGDVLEHIPHDSALTFIDYLKSEVASNILVVVPYNSQQDAYKGNVFEKHFQDDLSPLLFAETYKGFFCIAEGENNGVHIGTWIWPGYDSYSFVKCETNKCLLFFDRFPDFFKKFFGKF